MISIIKLDSEFDEFVIELETISKDISSCVTFSMSINYLKGLERKIPRHHRNHGSIQKKFKSKVKSQKALVCIFLNIFPLFNITSMCLLMLLLRTYVLHTNIIFCG